MANAAHCFYCFECLDASFERSHPPKLEGYLDLYERYIADTRPAQSSEDTVDDDGTVSEDEVDGDDSLREETRAQSRPTRARPQNPNISRLQASQSSSRSSSASSPSTISASSSASHLSGSSAATSLAAAAAPTYASRLSVTDSFPLFVTWNTLSRSGHKSLRGCIGTFEALPLASGLQSYSLTSAFEDTRFSPISASLLPSLSCSLTLLADFETCADALDWDLGTHGIRISFIHRNRRYGATYLPDVAVEQGWTKEETLESLMRKAGWDGGHHQGMGRRLLRGSQRDSEPAVQKPWDEVSEFKTVRYTGLKSSGSYAEWQEFRRWAEDQGHSIE
jgi:AMME syndrome candidate gene 1 protein